MEHSVFELAPNVPISVKKSEAMSTRPFSPVASAVKKMGEVESRKKSTKIYSRNC